MLRLYDTARGEVRSLEQREPGKVSMYVCGPTVYGPPHIGHGRQTLVYDVLRRYLEWTGLEVRHVSNITDVDDNIINRAARESRDWTDVATKCEAVWWKAMDAIGVRRPTDDPHASAFIDRMVELIGELVERGIAYETSDGVYFEAARVDAEARKKQKAAGARHARIATLEARIAETEAAIREVEQQMSAPGFYEDRAGAQPVIDRHQALMWQVGDLMHQWEELQSLADLPTEA